MVGESKRWSLEDLLNEKQVHQLLKQTVGDVPWVLQGCEVKPATEGLAGFLGEHLRGTIRVTVDREVKNIQVFIKCIPTSNKPKAEFIDGNNYFKREKLMFKIFEEVRDHNDPKPWCPKAYIYTDSLIVMPDLAPEGYASRHYLLTLDLEHMLLAAAAIAHFHASFTNYETNKTIAGKRPYNINEEYTSLLEEATFCDSPWLTACAKLSTNFLKAFSSKSYRNLPDLESRLKKSFLVACDNMKEHKGTLNVLIHKDLWTNNIMFKYENDVPTNALIVDFQLIRYTPPAFDVMTFLYLNTSRSFRERHEKEVCDHYFSVFYENLNDESKRRMCDLGYDKKSFLYWCEQARMFGVFEPMSINPFILMNPKAAQEIFDNPETFEQYINQDRTEPVLAYAHNCSVYRERLLEVSEEYVERYIINE